MPKVTTNCHAIIELDQVETAIVKQVLERADDICLDLGKEATRLRELLLAQLPQEA